MAEFRYSIKSEELICSICLESWVHKDARMFACQHTYCLECIRGFWDNSMLNRCPTCRNDLLVLNNDPNNTPKNILRFAIQEEAVPQNDEVNIYN